MDIYLFHHLMEKSFNVPQFIINQVHSKQNKLLLNFFLLVSYIDINGYLPISIWISIAA